MIKNFKEIITELKSQIPIQDLISEHITLKKSGRGFVGLCPFHDDHHPSLQIHPQKGIFKCFSCGTGGDIITFYALITKKEWKDAIPELALKYGIKVEYGAENKTETEIKNKLYDLNNAAMEFFISNVHKETRKEALSYLTEKRKLNEETIKKYKIGFVPDEWDLLYNYFTKEKKYPQELILASGLFIPRENQDGYYDRFRNRIIFPIFNESGNVIGFGGRTFLKADSNEPKYINSPETLIYNKGQTLYGLNFARDEIKKLDCVILTEGYLDVITAHQNGFLNTVATLGTAMTLNQARLLAKYTVSKRINLCMDTDSAGKKSIENIFRLTQDLQASNLDIKVITDLSAKDLDESLQKEDLTSIKAKIENGQKLIYFIFDRIFVKYLKAQEEDNDINKKSALEEITETLAQIKDPIEQNENLQYISHKLNINEELISLKIKEKNKSLRQKFLKVQSYKEKDKEEKDDFKMYTFERFKHAEIELLVLYIGSFPNKSEIKTKLSEIKFIDEKYCLIKDFLDNLETDDLKPEEVINKLLIEFNEYKHIMSVISELALKIETNTDSEYLKNKDQILNEAKEWIKWWVTNKQQMQNLREKLKICKNEKEETTVLQEMMNIVKNNTTP